MRNFLPVLLLSFPAFGAAADDAALAVEPATMLPVPSVRYEDSRSKTNPVIYWGRDLAQACATLDPARVARVDVGQVFGNLPSVAARQAALVQPLLAAQKNAPEDVDQERWKLKREARKLAAEFDTEIMPFAQAVAEAHGYELVLNETFADSAFARCVKHLPSITTEVLERMKVAPAEGGAPSGT